MAGGPGTRKRLPQKVCASSELWYIYIYCLVVSSMNLIFHFISGMSSFPLTNSYFSRWLKPPTTYICIYKYNHINYNMFSSYLYIYGIYIYTYITPDNNLHKAWSPGSKVGISWWWDLWGRRVGLFCFWCEKHGHVINYTLNIAKCIQMSYLPESAIQKYIVSLIISFMICKRLKSEVAWWNPPPVQCTEAPQVELKRFLRLKLAATGPW